MNTLLTISISFLAGILLGVFYFLGIWYTVIKTAIQRKSVVYLILSFLVRVFTLLICFYFIVQGGVILLISALVGFILGRQIIFYKLKVNN
jgi:F1F0 ATPase subunit 2